MAASGRRRSNFGTLFFLFLSSPTHCVSFETLSKFRLLPGMNGWMDDDGLFAVPDISSSSSLDLE